MNAMHLIIELLHLVSRILEFKNRKALIHNNRWHKQNSYPWRYFQNKDVPGFTQDFTVAL